MKEPCSDTLAELWYSERELFYRRGSASIAATASAHALERLQRDRDLYEKLACPSPRVLPEVAADCAELARGVAEKMAPIEEERRYHEAEAAHCEAARLWVRRQEVRTGQRGASYPIPDRATLERELAEPFP